MRYLMFTVILLTCACHGSYSSNYTVEITPVFTTDQQETIASATQEWQQAVFACTGNTLVLSPVITDFQECGSVECNDVITINNDTQADLDFRVGANSLGFTSREDYPREWANIWLTTDFKGYDEKSFRLVALHELGHAMGLHHTGPGTVMYYETGSDMATYVTCADVAQWANLRGL